MRNVINKKTLVEEITELIRENIVSGIYTPGSKISLRQLANSLNVSRTPLREAARIIVTEGLAIYEPRKGFVIKNLNMKEVNDIYEIREILEIYASKLACKYATNKDFKKLLNIKNEIISLKINFNKNPRLIRKMHELNRDFHFGIYRISKNKILENIITNLWNRSSCIIYYILNSPNRINDLIKEHEYIYESLIKRDEKEIEKAIKYH